MLVCARAGLDSSVPGFTPLSSFLETLSQISCPRVQSQVSRSKPEAQAGRDGGKNQVLCSCAFAFGFERP